MKIDEMDLTQAVIYRSTGDIVGVKPYFVLPNQEMVEYFSVHGGAPEAELIDWAAQFLPEYGSFVDIGSHCGTWGNSLGLGRGAWVQSFEAQPWLAALTNAGYALNGIGDRCYCRSGALSDRAAEMTMRVPIAVNHSTLTAAGFDGVKLETGGASIAENNHVIDEQGFAELTVQTSTLDNHWLEPALIKIDVEGAERQVLEGAANTIGSFKPTILFECWEDERGQNIEELFRYLRDDLDYRAVNVQGWPEMWLAEPA